MAIIAWVVCGLIGAILHYGFDFAYFQREYPTIAEWQYEEDKRQALKMAILTFILGPIGLISSQLSLWLADCHKHGLKFK